MLLKNELKHHRVRNIFVSSAGLYAYPGSPPDPEMVGFLKEKGVPIEEHESRQITGSDVDWADRIIVMEHGHFEAIEEAWPKAGTKTELLGKFIDQNENADDIIDPYGKTQYHYRLVKAQITLAIENLRKDLLIAYAATPNAQD